MVLEIQVGIVPARQQGLSQVPLKVSIRETQPLKEKCAMIHENQFLGG